MAIYTFESPYMHSLKDFAVTPLNKDLNRFEIQQLLLAGSQYSDVIVNAFHSGLISKEHILDAGLSILELGFFNSDGEEKLLTPVVAGKVVLAMAPRDLDRINRHDVHLTKILGSSITELTPHLLTDMKHEIEEERINEVQKRIFHLLYDGYVDLFHYQKEKPSEEHKETGKAFIEALIHIPDFKVDFDRWCKSVLSVSTYQNASLPHLFGGILERFGLNNSSGRDAYCAVKDAYQTNSGREMIREVCELTKINTGTGDRYTELDSIALPLIYDKVGKHPGWAELTVSKGVVMLGSISRMQTMGMQPVWISADLYRHDELWRLSDGYYQVSDPESPWETKPLHESDRVETKARVDEIFMQPNHLGFLRANFESDNFHQRVLKHWRQNSGSSFPDVVRMTGTLGVSAQSIENLIRIVNPNGGVIIQSGGNAINAFTDSVWQIFRNGNDQVKMKPLYLSEFGYIN